MIENTDFILKEPKNTSYSVTYGLYTDKEKYPWNSIKNPYIDETESTIEGVLSKANVAKWHASFSSLGDRLSNKDYTRIVYYFKPHDTMSKKISLRWLILAKQHKLLPRYVNVKKIIEKNNVVFDLTKGSFNLLYAYLATVRMIVEEPAYVKNALMLVDKYKIDYYVAVVAASYFCFRNFGHSFFNPGNTYPGLHSPDKLTKLSLKTVLGVYRFVNKDVNTIVNDSKHFSATSEVSGLSKTNAVLDINKCIGVNVLNVLKAKNDTEAEKELKNIWGVINAT